MVKKTLPQLAFYQGLSRQSVRYRTNRRSEGAHMMAWSIPGLEDWIRREALAWFLAGNVEGAEDLLAVARELAR